MPEHTIDTDAVEQRYNDRIDKSVADALAYLETVPQLQLNFNMAARDNLAMDGHNNPASRMFYAMDSRNHTLSSINMAFARVIDGAIDLGRPVETRKMGDGYRVSIKPLEPVRN